VVVLASGNRDERQFPEPTRFAPDRQNVKRHVAFGYGAHFCLGAPLGRLEGRIAFERLLSRLDEIRIGPENDFKYLESPLFRGLKELHLEFQAS
jgi:cytochrome P450